LTNRAAGLLVILARIFMDRRQLSLFRVSIIIININDMFMWE